MRERTAEAQPASALVAAVDEFVTVLARERRASRHTVDAYGRDLGQLVAFVAERRPTASSPRDIDVLVLRAWLGRLAERVSPASIARKMAAARAFFRHQI